MSTSLGRFMRQPIPGKVAAVATVAALGAHEALTCTPECAANDDPSTVHRRWLVTTADGLVMSITRSPLATLAEMQRDHPGAEIRPDPEPAPIRPLDPESLSIIGAWLDAIGETDPTTRAEYIDGLTRDPERLAQTFLAAVAAGVATWDE
jgi:hypothetical protein